MPEQAARMQCRGQVTPESKRLRYEVFVHSVSAGPIPSLQADVLVRVDGLKAFHARGLALRLVPGWPLEAWKSLPVPSSQRGHGAPVLLQTLGGLAGYQEPKPVATTRDGLAFDYASLLACAWGRPSTSFGPFYRCFDGTRRVARLPGPPYHFMSRVLRVDGEMGGMRSGWC